MGGGGGIRDRFRNDAAPARGARRGNVADSRPHILGAVLNRVDIVRNSILLALLRLQVQNYHVRSTRHRRLGAQPRAFLLAWVTFAAGGVYVGWIPASALAALRCRACRRRWRARSPCCSSPGPRLSCSRAAACSVATCRSRAVPLRTALWLVLPAQLCRRFHQHPAAHGPRLASSRRQRCFLDVPQICKGAAGRIAAIAAWASQRRWPPSFNTQNRSCFTGSGNLATRGVLWAIRESNHFATQSRRARWCSDICSRAPRPARGAADCPAHRVGGQTAGVCPHLLAAAVFLMTLAVLLSTSRSG